jgi:hypothetical protein
MTDLFIGVDPGTKGGIYILNAEGNITHSCRFSKVTTYDIVQFLRETIGSVKAIAVLEKVHAMPMQGVSSTFKFGEAYGTIKGILASLGIVYDEVTPRSWQKALGIPAKKKEDPKTKHKQDLKFHAQRLFPEERVILETADSLLLAKYCYEANK